MFEQFLIYLSQMTYKNMQTAYKQTENISIEKKHKTIIDDRPLRSYTFQAS